MTNIIFWHRIIVTDLTGTDHTYMYPSRYKIFDPVDMLTALEDLDCSGYPASFSYAGWSTFEAGKDAGYWFYRMEG